MPRQSAFAITLTLLALILGYSWANRATVVGQEDRQARTDIALVDMVKLFNADKEYVAKREELQSEVAEAQKAFQEKQQVLMQLQTEGRKAKPGSEEQRRIGTEFQQKAKETEEFRQNHILKVLEAEKMLNIKTYRVIADRIQKYADEKGIRLVIRFAAQPLDETKPPQEILALINQDVVYQSGLDITEEILQTLN
ncbi:MAG: OmpH family outer membrane protein [Planctomycetota bacterium]|nr:OmpH family outer membrane protein [Planctomycetota bacterium]